MCHLQELNVVELPWHDTQTEPIQPAKNPELLTKRVPIKGKYFLSLSYLYYSILRKVGQNVVKILIKYTFILTI